MSKVILTADASGSAMAGKMGLVVVVVDVIDFSTSMEAAIDAGAAAIYGTGTDSALPPVEINPYRVGNLAGLKARELGTGVVLVAEPRVGEEMKRKAAISRVMGGIEASGAEIAAVLPNMGAETPLLTDMKGRVIVGATNAGGAAYDAAVTAGSPRVLTGTVARTLAKDGFCSARDAADRAASACRRLGKGVAIVAASGNSPEDLMAAEMIYRLVLSKIR
jgi:hypothetical protein